MWCYLVSPLYLALFHPSCFELRGVKYLLYSSSSNVEYVLAQSQAEAQNLLQGSWTLQIVISALMLTSVFFTVEQNHSKYVFAIVWTKCWRKGLSGLLQENFNTGLLSLAVGYQKRFWLVLSSSHLNKRQQVGSNFNILHMCKLKIVFSLVQDVATHCDVKCMPTFQFYKSGKKVGSAP